MPTVPKYVRDAIKCGAVPRLRSWQTLPVHRLTDGELVLRFAKDCLVFPEGKMIGQPLELDVFQQVFILAAFDSPKHINKAILSVARRAGKTLVMAVICLAFTVGPHAKQNTNVRSAAMTRDQASLLWRMMNLICKMSPQLAGLYSSTPSGKKVIGLSKNVEYHAMSRDAKSQLGTGIYVLVLDEAGQIDAPNDDFLDMLFSSMGTYTDSRTFIISTQAPGDAAFLSVEMDTAERDTPEDVVVHLYTAPTDDLLSKRNWNAANPSLRGGYRSIEDIQRSAVEADAIPAKQNGFLNLFMNRRVSLMSLWLAPKVWKTNSDAPDWDVFREEGVIVGLDLSQKNDLTVACISAKDEHNVIHTYPFAFTPMEGIEDRSRRDKVPYDAWARDGVLTAVPGKTIDYDFVADFLRVHLEEAGIIIHSIEFDRWRISTFIAACERVGLECDVFNEVGQGFRDISPRLEALETVLFQGRVRHGAHPVFNLGASSAISVSDPAGNRKLDKTKAANKIDAIIALLMSAYPLAAGMEEDSKQDLSWLIAG